MATYQDDEIDLAISASLLGAYWLTNLTGHTTDTHRIDPCAGPRGAPPRRRQPLPAPVGGAP